MMLTSPHQYADYSLIVFSISDLGIIGKETTLPFYWTFPYFCPIL